MMKGWKSREAAAHDRAVARQASADIRAQRAAFLAVKELTRQAEEAGAEVAQLKAAVEQAKVAPTLDEQLEAALKREAETIKELQATRAVIQQPAASAERVAEGRRAK